MYSELVDYVEEWGTADATLGNELGRWCQVQRRLRSYDKLGSEQISALDSLGFSWASPSDPEDVFEAWDARLYELSAYVEENGNGQVPKKFKSNPVLGGWVAAVRRRGPIAFSDEQNRQLESAGFEWMSTRICGSNFMKSFRKLRDFHEENGHCESEELMAWSDAQRKAAAKGMLSDQRLDYLRSINFRFE